MHLCKVDVVRLRLMASGVTQLQQAVGNLHIKAQNMYLESQICSGDLVELSGGWRGLLSHTRLSVSRPTMKVGQ